MDNVTAINICSPAEQANARVISDMPLRQMRTHQAGKIAYPGGQHQRGQDPAR